MGLNVKMAGLLCLVFTGGMCWLVNQVGAPLASLPPAAAAQTLEDAASPGEAIAAARRAAALELPPPVTATIPKPRFAHPSASQVEGLKLTAEQTIVADVSPRLDPVAEQPLPPLALVVAPVEVSDPLVLAATEIPEAVIEEPSARRATDLLLAAETQDNFDLEPRNAKTPPAEPEVTALAVSVSTTHVVRNGDSLTRIAKKYYGSTDANLVRGLLMANPAIAQRAGQTMQVGEKVSVPLVDKVSTAPRRSEDLGEGRGVERGPSRTRLASAKAAESGKLRSAAKPARSAATKAAPRWVTAKKDDSLVAIARRFLNDERRWREIQRINGMSGSRLTPGQRLKLPTQSAT
jgi:nucleoid-associated protein YgaU